MTIRSREEYLQRVVSEFRKDMKSFGVALPEFYISVGHTGQGRTIGLTYGKEHSPDKLNQVFISPWISDTDILIPVVAHECVHVALDPYLNHGKEFMILARQIGMTKPYTQAIPNTDMIQRMKKIKDKIGCYPHPGFHFGGRKPTECRIG